MSKYSAYKDFSLRQKINTNYNNIFLIKSLLLNQKIEKKIRFKIMLKFNRKYNKLNTNKLKNRCIFSTKIRSVSRLTNLTKSTFREYLRWGKVSGFKKASW